MFSVCECTAVILLIYLKPTFKNCVTTAILPRFSYSIKKIKLSEIMFH